MSSPTVFYGVAYSDLNIQSEDQYIALSHWNSIRGNLDIPPRKAFDPLDLHRILESVFLAEACGHDWFYRVVGSEIGRHVGIELTGKLVSACDNTLDTRRILADFKCVSMNRIPYRHLFGCTVRSKPWLLYDRLLLPMGSANEVTHILGVTHFDTDSSKRSLFPSRLPSPPSETRSKVQQETRSCPIPQTFMSAAVSARRARRAA